jgi:hypothetical protein
MLQMTKGMGVVPIAWWTHGALRAKDMGSMKKNSSGWHWIIGLTVVFTALNACTNEQSDQKGSGGMFGLFGKKAVKPATSVAPELGATLQAHTAVPAQLPPPATPAFPACQIEHIRGKPPAAQWAPAEVTGETRRLYSIPAATGGVPLAVLEGAEANDVQVWELSDDKPARFLKRRQVVLDPAQASWTLAYPVAVACLPGKQAAVAIGYHDPIRRDALFIYNTATNQFRSLGKIETDTSTGPPFVPFEVLAAAPEAMLVLYHTDAIRLGPDNYVYRYDHVFLVSPRHPQGIEIIKLGIDDGNVRAWAMQGKTLWLQASDRRQQPRDFTWSLDLEKVL